MRGGRWLAAIVVSAFAGGCDGFFPSAPDPEEILEGPLDGLTAGQRAAFLAGDADFGRVFGVADGLGPIFIAPACASCHVGDGKGHPVMNLTRFGRMEEGRFDPMRAEGGPQLQHRAILHYIAEVVPAGASGVARFTAPSVTGLGYLEAVEDSVLLALADPDDANGDGISGRVQLLAPSDLLAEVSRLELLFDPGEPRRHLLVDGRYIGRFGKKASAINLLHQTVTAYREDMGLTTDLILDDPINPQVGNFAGDNVPDPEVSSSTVSNVVFYLKTLRAPPRRNAGDPEVLAGEARFGQIGCAKCHVPALTTGPSRVAALDRKIFHAYTDLLLHDMGPELDDYYTEGRALTSEWRTAPLWGIGLAERSQGGQAFYLHDGRAATLEQAIELHGGEGAASRKRFLALTRTEQQALLAFLRSL
ncbi:MAG: di-heme oxidoredictase family protein [Gemmatimonadales bacterium]